MSKRRFGKIMRRLGRKHGQESVITKDKNKPTRLHDTESKKPKSMNVGKSKAVKTLLVMAKLLAQKLEVEN